MDFFLNEKFTVSYYNSQNEIKEILAYKILTTSFYFDSFFLRGRITDLTYVIPLRDIISFFREETKINYYIINLQGEC